MRKELLICCTGAGHSRLQTEPGQSPELQCAFLTVLLSSHLYNQGCHICSSFVLHKNDINVYYNTLNFQNLYNVFFLVFNEFEKGRVRSDLC